MSRNVAQVMEAAAGMALYTARAVLHGQAGDVVEMIRENTP